ncbi:DUF1214 domain-containing protein [Mycolicibacterium austroafricanum]|uniref:DUF1214 domain-containing protein n=1 Tax=Mycolicibacterium austroafricanum TaxID=39687 RepID=A0ABT8HAG4_MYCAO|nr:DUF1214 domain-containing protein [Mycolicibacterium austroafricanum]MDN4517755.1 DUF1214 domain-containing protein [Mycolicibacterium austroafricanum]PQP45692.1 hypothetical protein C6A88_19505 [Mycolicibacterium austroafricanum]QRZ09864.1 DUF1214 domain-containing protein [Mycolicibacterium austroafricanum]QZT59931.1 DUF1214 domain-containing protein [Mycolicibacterium austroafricanum]QZT71324.1 DUF1214 domain-containing protein [Mycolicibacterium austroafricanum]
MDAEGNHVAASLQSWQFVQQMLADLTTTVIQDATSERELLEGLAVIAKTTALCAEMTVEADAQRPRFFDMCTETRLIGGPNPDGRYLLAMIRGDRTYRVTGNRGSSAYLGFQVLAGTGLTPRRMACYLGDRELVCEGGSFDFLLSATRPAPETLGGAQWLQIPDDASSIVVREYIGDREAETPASMSVECVDADPLQPISDEALAAAFTAMAWTIVKLATLHRTVKPELLTAPNVLVTAEAAELGSAETTPDNLYMIGSFALEADETLLLEFTPPDTRYWNVTLENVWHECLEPRHRHSSVTNRGVRPDPAGVVRIAVSGKDFGHGHWLDTGGRHRGFVVVRWLDNPAAPVVRTTVRRGAGS